MAESNATQVILTDDGIKIINAQNTADNAASQASKADSAALIAQSKANAARSAADSAYNYANSEISVQSTATAKAQSKADDAFSKATAVGDKANSEIAIQSTATAKAQETADNAFNQAQAVGKQASAEILVQSTATAKAQSKADDAFSKATIAIDNGQVTSQAVTDLKDGSKLTIAELENGLATKVANSDYASYKEQTASQIGQMVTNGAFSAYQQTTADLISEKVATKDFTAYQATTAKSIESKVESNDFNTYKSQTANLINDKVSSAKYTSDKTQTDKDIASKVSSDDFSTYKTQTNELIGSKVSNGDFSTYKEQTADLISSKVATSDFSAYQATTAKAISSKVESKDFKTYKEQTAGLISQTVTNAVDNISIGGRNIVLDSSNMGSFGTWQQDGNYQLSDDKKEITITTSHGGIIVHKKNLSEYLPNNGDTIVISADVKGSSHLQFNYNDGNVFVGSGTNITVTTEYKRYFTTFEWNPVNLDKSQFVIYSTGSADQYLTIKNVKIEIGNKATDWSPAPEDQATQSQFTQLSGEIEQKVNSGDFSTYKSQTADLIAEKVATKDFTTYKEQTAGLISEKVATKDFTAYQDTTAKAIESKVESKDFNTYKSQTADTIAEKVATKDFSTYKSQTADAINARVIKGDLIDEINLQAGSTLISSSGQLTLSGKNIYFDTSNPVTIPSANITGMLNGKTITGSTINGSTINGTTFNAGNKLNQYGNTSYPLTINQDGSVTSTSFGNIANDPAALRTVMKDGTVKTNFRGMKQLSTGMYSAADVSLGAGQLALLEGYSTSQDPNFTATGMKTTGYVILDASAGLSLHGTTQAINFSGTDQNQTTGITMNSYGNIIGYPNATWWRIVSNSGSNIANFGIDSAGSNVIQFNRELDIGNLQINTGHTFTSADNGDIHFAKGRGGAANIYAGAVHYTSLVKSSLLSVKKDVKKADTAYWAQLVNSIDLATYQYKTDDNTSHLRLSSIVDDVNVTKQWQLPDVFVSRDENGKLIGVDDSVLLNAILATVQEHQKEIDQLNGHNMELESRLNKLEEKLNG